MHCNGHCYLSKQLKNAEEGERKQAQNILKEKDEVVSDNNTVTSVIYFPAYTSRAFISYLSLPYSSGFLNHLVKPPAA